MSGPSREAEARGGEVHETDVPRLVYSQLMRVRSCDRDRDLDIPPAVWLRMCMELRLSGAAQLRDLLGGRYVVKAQLLKLHPVVREMRPFDVIVSQSIGAIGESSFEFLYAIREVDNKAADYAGRLLATGLAVCVPVRAPGERLPISAGFRELVHQTKEALRRASYPTDSRGEAYVGNEGIRVSGAPIGAIDDGDSSAQDRQLMKDMLAVQLSGFKSPASSSAVSVEGNMLTMPVLLRPSDEDWNHHINNTSYIRFFDDALCVMRELMPSVKKLAMMTPSKAAFDYLHEATLGCTACQVLCKFYDGSEAQGVDDGMHAWNPDGLASVAMLFRGYDSQGVDRIFARARFAFPKLEAA